MNISQAYEKVNAVALSGATAPLTLAEAQKAVAKMYRHLTGKRCPYTVVETTGNRITWSYHKEFRVNVSKGWNDLIHTFSHWYYARFIDGGRPHTKKHARIELKLWKWALARGWFNGALKVSVLKAPITPDEERARLIERRRTQVTRLERKIKSLTTRLRNVKRSLQALERHALRRAQ